MASPHFLLTLLVDINNSVLPQRCDEISDIHKGGARRSTCRLVILRGKLW